MGFRRGVAIVMAGAALLVWQAPARAKVVVIPPRPGQVGLSIQGQYGGLLSSGSLGSNFDFGPGLAVRLIYRMRYERGIGLSFESQNYDARSSASFDSLGVPIPNESPGAPKRLTVTLSGVDFYQMFGTRTRTTRMLSAGFGLAQTHYTLNDGEIAFGENADGAYATVGAGFERFFFGSFAWDASARYQALFLDGTTNHAFQVSLGLAFYASY